MSREELQEALCHYTTDTLTSINTVRTFCKGNSKRRPTWDKVLKNMEDIAGSERSHAQQEEELSAQLKVTLEGLKVLDRFLDAVEKLAVTSLHVFMEENQVIRLPTGISLKQVQEVITAARLICPLLVLFKRDAKVFFIPKLQNVEVLCNQLKEYIKTTESICEAMEKSFSSDLQLQMNTECEVNLGVDLSEDEIRKMLQHISELKEIRMDPHFRMVFLFQEVSCSGFIKEFNERQPGMQKFLEELEEFAVQLDKTNKCSNIFSVVGSSVGAVGGVLSIVGFALIPFTAGLSAGLMIGGTAAGVGSTAISAVEWGVNSAQKTEADNVFKKFIEDVQSLQGYLRKVSSQAPSTAEASNIDAAALSLGHKAQVIAKVTDGAVGVVGACKARKAHRAYKVASKVPRFGKTAAKGSLALTKAARAGAIGVNAFFLGMDIFFICKDGSSLANGSETEVSKFIRARAPLWSSEMDSWKRIHDSLHKGQLTSEKKKAVLEKPFYPGTSRNREGRNEVPLSECVDEN